MFDGLSLFRDKLCDQNHDIVDVLMFMSLTANFFLLPDAVNIS